MRPRTAPRRLQPWFADGIFRGPDSSQPLTGWRTQCLCFTYTVVVLDENGFCSASQPKMRSTFEPRARISIACSTRLEAVDSWAADLKTL